MKSATPLQTKKLCNSINELAFHPEVTSKYSFNPAKAGLFATLIAIYNKLPDSTETRLVTVRKRNHQSKKLLTNLFVATIPTGLCPEHYLWLKNVRHLTDKEIREYFCTIKYDWLEEQEMLDLNIIPDDHIIDIHGVKPIDGPAAYDWRNGDLAGMCIRNISSDLTFASDAKYTFTNYPWFIWGFDDYESTDTITITEGIFDAIALRRLGYKAIALGSAAPTPWQLACLVQKFQKFNVCFDNDLWGYAGAYIIGQCLQCPMLIVENTKDPGQILESDGYQVRPIDCAGIHDLIDQSILTLQPTKPIRPLPYN